MRKTSQKIRIVIGAVVVIVCIVSVSVVWWYLNSVEFSGMTAKEAKKIADDYAKNWDKNAVFIGLRSGGQMVAGGKFHHWYVEYAKQNAIGNYTECIEFKVLVNHKAIKIERSPVRFWGSCTINWSMDSPEAFRSGMANKEISTWLSKYKDAKVESMGLGKNLNYSANPIWVIDWYSPGFMDDPHNARIIIDAHTGEVLEVEAQMD